MTLSGGSSRERKSGSIVRSAPRSPRVPPLPSWIGDDGRMLWPLAVRRRPSRRRPVGAIDLRWLTARAWSQRWYPQGIDVGGSASRRVVAVGWFRQDRDRRHLASRVTFVDVSRARRRDVVLVVRDEQGVLQPATIHVGGLAWYGDRLFAAATTRGIWEFDLGDVRRVRGAEARRVTASVRSTALVAVRRAVHPVDLRCSFIGRVFDEDGTPLPRVLIGEYRGDDSGRVGEFIVPDADGRAGFLPQGEFSPGIPRMQGAVRWGDQHFVSQSDDGNPGVLWSGGSDDLKRHPVALPAGCEDLAIDPDSGMLWSLGEHPWRRVVRGIPLALIGIEHGPGERRLDG